MMLCEKLFGTNVFAIRLPNLIGAALYLFSTAMMCRRIRSPFIGVLAYMVLNTNPYMIQYFGVARGYGIAAGFMSFAFWQLWVYFDNGYKMRNLIPAIMAGTLAVFANYSYFNLFLPVAGFTGIIALWRPGASISSMRARIIPAVFIAVIVLGSLAVIIPIAQSIKEAGGFWPSGLTTFWSGSIMTIVHCMLNDVTHDATTVDRIIIIIGELYFVAALAAIVWTIVKWKDGERPLFPIFIFTVLSLSGLSVMVQFWLMGTEIVIQRMGLFMLWPFMILISLAAGLPGKFNAFVHLPFTAITGILVWHFLSTASLEHEVYHPSSENVDDAIAYMQETDGHGDRIRISVDPEIYISGFEFYMHTSRLADFDVVTADSMWTHPLNAYCLLTGRNAGKISGENWAIVKQYSNNNVLYRNNNSFTLVQEKQLNVESDTIALLNEERGGFSVAYRVNDTIVDSSKTLVRMQFLMKRDRFSRGSSWIAIHRGGKEKYVHRADYRIFPYSDEWVPVEYTVVLPDLRIGDDIVIGQFRENGNEILLKQLSVTIEAWQ